MKFPDVIFSAGFDRALAWTMLHSIWQATLIALLAGVLLLVLRRRPARVRYGVVNLALLAVLLTSAGTFTYYLRPMSPPVVTKFKNAAFPVLAPAENPAPALQTGVAIAQPVADRRPNFRTYFDNQLPLIVLIWFLGVTVFLCRLLSGVFQVHRLRHRMNFPADPYWGEILQRMVQRSGCRRGVALLESALVRSPLTIGHLKPIILFPIGLINRLSEQEVEAVLAHEIGHILRRDYLFNLLQSVVEAIFYFHPAVWWLSAQVRQERESACDDRAIGLLGSKVKYARALVAVQETVFYPVHPALAFAGSRSGQLVLRIQRLFSPPTTKFNIMEKWIATVLVVFSLVALAFGQRLQHSTSVTETVAITHNSGLWEADFKGDSVCMTFSSKTKEGNWMTGECFAGRNFTNLNVVPGETVFQLVRPAGTMTMTGKIETGTGYGRFEFAPSEDYRATLTKQGIKDADDELLVQCFFANFPTDYVDYLKRTGYTAITKDELLQLAVFRLNEVAVQGYLAMANSMGNKSVPLEQLIELKVANVGPDNVKQLAKAGYTSLTLDQVSQLSLQDIGPSYIDSMNTLFFGKLAVEDLISARVQDVDPDYVRQCRSLGLGDLSFDDIINAKVQGVDPLFVKQCRDMQLGDLSFDAIVNLKVQGIDANYVQQCRSMGFGNLSLDDIVSAKVQGIDAGFIKQCRDMGFTDLTFDDVMSAKVQGIDADFARQCQALGFGKLSFEDIMSMKVQDVTPAYVQQCRDMGLGPLSLEEVMSMKVQGVDPAGIRQYQQMNIGPLTVENLINVSIHDITPQMVQSFRDLHFDNLTVDDLVNARIHEATPEFIREANRKGYRFPTLGEYAELKARMKSRRAE